MEQGTSTILKASSNADPDEKKKKDGQHELDCIEDEKDHKKKKKEQSEADREKAHARIWDEHTAEPVKSWIVNLSDFEKSVRDKPIESSTRIREITLMPKMSRCHCNSMTEAMLSFLSCKQKENESSRDHHSRWKQARDDIKEHVGDDWIEHCGKETKMHKEETSKSAQDELLQDGLEHWTAHMFIRNSDDVKHGSLKQELRGRHGGGFDECPRSPEAACHMLMEHKWDNAKEKNEKSKDKDKNTNGTEDDQHVSMNQK